MSEEFEDQLNDQDGLGELPTPISSERGEVWPPTGEPVSPPYFGEGLFPGQNRYNIPPDIAAENARRVLGGDISSPKIHQLVNSSFDTLPVNARDFNSVGELGVNTDDDLNIDPTQYDYNVPDGYVGILRGFKFYADVPIVPDRSDYILISVLVDGIVHPDYENMPLGQNSNGMVPIHALISGNKAVSLKFTPSLLLATAASAWGVLEMTFNVTLFGNLLLSRGFPLEFENISQVKG